MKVAFDVTPLGSGRFYPRSRTGIFRVCSELVTALSAPGDIDICFTALACRGEAQEELREMGIRADVYRSAWDRFTYPCVRALFVPKGFRAGMALSERRRKALRSFVRAAEYKGGHPASLARAVDVCHSPYLPPSQVGWKDQTPRLVTVHDVLPLTHREFFPNGDDHLLRRVVEDIQNGAHAHCVSEFTRRQLLTLLPEAAERTFVAPLATNRSRFYSRGRDEVSSVCQRYGIREPYLLCVGTLDPRKNLSVAFEAFDAIAAKRADVQLVITGAAARNAPSIAELAKSYPRSRNAWVVTGFVPEEDLPSLYSGAELALFPSLAEGFGLPALEAMSCGAPLLVSNATSLPEVVGDGATILDPRDATAWATAILELLDDAAARAALAEAGTKRAAEFSWETTAERLRQAYRELAAAK